MHVCRCVRRARISTASWNRLDSCLAHLCRLAMELDDYALTFTVDPEQLLMDQQALQVFTSTLQAQLAEFFGVPVEQVRRPECQPCARSYVISITYTCAWPRAMYGAGNEQSALLPWQHAQCALHTHSSVSFDCFHSPRGPRLCAVQVIVTRVYATDADAASRRATLATGSTQECAGFAPRPVNMGMLAHNAAAGALPLDTVLLTCRRSVPHWNGWQVSLTGSRGIQMGQDEHAACGT